MSYELDTLDRLEAESIQIIREVAGQFENPVILYSVGKDSGCLVHLVRKAFHPGPVPWPLLHIDTGYKFPEMIEFRDRFCAELGLTLLVERNEEAIAEGCHPDEVGRDRCCARLKTEALLGALTRHGFDAALGGARRDEEKSRAKERIFSPRDRHGRWEPRRQRPEFGDLYNGRVRKGEHVRVFPLSNWTELDVWLYIDREAIEIVGLYRAESRPVVDRDGIWLPEVGGELRSCRFRTLGCVPCTGAVDSTARSIEEIQAELDAARRSERGGRLIDLESAEAMERKKKEGYF